MSLRGTEPLFVGAKLGVLPKDFGLALLKLLFHLLLRNQRVKRLRSAAALIS